MNWYAEQEKELRPDVPEESKSHNMEAKNIFPIGPRKMD